jgi:hypothetical protein
LLPAYQRFKETGDKVFAYNIKQGRTRGSSIMTVCKITQWVAAAIGIFIFALGFLVGMFK